MTRLKRARIALGVVAFANVALIAVTWPRPPKLAEWAVLIVAAGVVAIAYREDPARFRGEVDRRVAARIVAAPMIAVIVLISLAKTHAL